MKNNHKKDFILALGCLLLAFLLCMGQNRANEEARAARIAPEVLRFHILANSDGADDQRVKLEVRSLILDYVKQHLPAHATKADTTHYLTTHQSELEQTANAYLSENGCSYTAKMELTKCYFPSRTYDRFTFPCGTYDAVRIILGEGNGHNWWCVLYPQFCFSDAVCKEIPNESDAILRQKLTQDDYLALQSNRPDLHIRFLFFPF